MSSKTKIAAGAVALAAVTAVPVALHLGAAHADPHQGSTAVGTPVETTAPAHSTPRKSATATPVSIRTFGQTATVDGFKITVKTKHDGKERQHDAHPGHYSELVQIYVKPTSGSTHWALHWDQEAHYGKQHQLQGTVDDGEGFGNVDGTWYAWTRVGVGKLHYAKHFDYAFTFKGHKLHWVNN